MVRGGDGGKNTWFQPFAHAQNFPRNTCMGNCVTCISVFFRVMATCSDTGDEFSSALVLCIHVIYTDEEYSDWKPWRNDHVVIVLLFTL